jgi:hypothetical protein
LSKVVVNGSGVEFQPDALLEPKIVVFGDSFNAPAVVNAQDAANVLGAAARSAGEIQISDTPTNGGATGEVGNDPDPSIANFVGVPGQTMSVPVRRDVTDPKASTSSRRTSI